MSDRVTAARILEDAESRYFRRHKEQAYIMWSQEEDLIQAIEAALAAERETCAAFVQELWEKMRQMMNEVAAAERKACALFVHELWENGVPAQEFADRIRARG